MAQNTITTKGVLIINGKQVENTFKDLQATTRKLEAELRKLKPGTQEFIDKAQQVKLARQAFENVRNEINATTRELEKSEGIVGKVIKSFGGLGGVFTIGASVSLASTTQELLKISDAITDVQKTSGLAQKEVEALWKEFSNFDTRTSKLELMNIAQIGGRLGITDKEQLQEFTREIDKIYVALGDSFQGGLEEVTTKVGKLKNLFDETKDSDYPTALNEIGSALNELGANGTASESNIAEFATRIGQLPSALKPAIDKTLGLGAALEESGIDAQIGASGFTKFIAVAGENLPAFAQQMKITKEEATELFRTKPEEFFLRFAESTKHLQADEQIRVWDNLKLKTLEVQKTLGTAGDNANRFREMMELSSNSMADATSIQEEFNKKNNNAAAIWEKFGRTIKDFVTDGAVPEFFNWITGIVGYITGLTDKAGNGIKIFRERLSFLVKILVVVTSAMLSYKSAVYLAMVFTKGTTQQTILLGAAQRVWNALLVSGRSIIMTVRVAMLALTFQFGAAKKAMDAFNLATKMNPWGAILGVITAVIVAYQTFDKTLDSVAQKQKRANELQSAINEKMAKEVEDVRALVSVIESEVTSRQDKERAMKQLQQIAPEYFKTLDIDKMKTLEGKKAIDEYIKSLDKKYRVEELKKRMGQTSSKLRDMEQNKDVKQTFWQKIFNIGNSELDQDLEATYDQQMQKEIARAQELLQQGYSQERVEEFLKKRKETIGTFYADKNEEMRKLKNDYLQDKEELQRLLEENPETLVGDTPKEGDTKTENGITYVFRNGKWVPISNDSPKKYLGDLSGQADSELLKNQREHNKKQQELQDEAFALQEESLDKQLSQMEVNYNRKKQALQFQNQDIEIEIRKIQETIGKLREKIASSETSEAEKADAQRAIAIYQKSIAEKQKIIQVNNQTEIALENTKQHQLNLIREKWEIKRYEQEAKDFDKKIKNLKDQSELEIAEINSLSEAKQLLEERGYQGQLSRIKTLEEAKKALRKQADKEIIAASLETLENQKNILKAYLENVTGEQAEKLKENLDKLLEQIQKLKIARSEINSSDENKKNTLKGTDAENVDILGFSAGQWEQVFSNLDTTEGKLNAIGMAMQGLANLGSMLSQMQQAANDRELSAFEQLQDKKKAALKRQLDQGTLSQESYNKQLERMDAETANKKAELAHKQAQADKTFRLFAAIGNTAQAVAAALTAGGIMGPILAGIVGALGAVQIGIIQSQPLPPKPSYARGGRTKGLGFTDESGHEVAGVVHADEYVIPKWLRADPAVAHIEEWLEAKRLRGSASNSYAEGGRVAPSNDYKQIDEQVQQIRLATNETTLLQAVEKLIALLEKLDKEGIEAFFIADEKNGKIMQKAIKKYERLVNKNKH
ncbi:phage tail tape measure protein [Capnocytophaga canimorsus]|uniref:phage tail tape measure protein n=1 Tax=Capnocytophaga canimorsus TaxID=28188 RepID=UPI0028EEF7E9|nr:phage tail tape measure protein [Capnocytophaga canimorsus]MDT9499118.1 phage tail tape measure protein [Capnocytophaga canimorsus]